MTSVLASGGMAQEGDFAGTTNQAFARCDVEPPHADLRHDRPGVGHAPLLIDSASTRLA